MILNVTLVVHPTLSLSHFIVSFFLNILFFVGKCLSKRRNTTAVNINVSSYLRIIYSVSLYLESNRRKYIYLTNRVRGPYFKLRTEFFPIDLWPKREATLCPRLRDRLEKRLRHAIVFVSTDADKAVQHATPFSFPWPLGSQFSMMGLSELKAAISLENDSVASNERQRIMKWTVDDVMSHVRSLGCTEQAKIFADQVSKVLFSANDFVKGEGRGATSTVTRILAAYVSMVRLK